MRKGLIPAAICIGLWLSGCARAPTLQTISIDEIGTVQGIIKQQVGIYIAATHPPADQPVTVVINGQSKRVSELKFYCGNGNIDFDIKSIAVNLTTAIDRTRGVQFGVTAPAGTTTAAAQHSQSIDTGNSQTLSYTLWPLPYEEQEPAIRQQVPTDQDILKAELARVLLDLRNSLIVAATRLDYSRPDTPAKPLQACFSDYDPEQPGSTPGNTFTLSLNISKDSARSLTVTVGSVALGPNRDTKVSSGQSVTVTFVQRGAAELQALRDDAASECKPPVASRSLCSVAQTALRIARESGPDEQRDFSRLRASAAALCHPATVTSAHKGDHADKVDHGDRGTPRDGADCTRAETIVATLEKLSRRLNARQEDASASGGGTVHSHR